jgi:Protein of unknown function (DUF1761)
MIQLNYVAVVVAAVAAFAAAFGYYLVFGGQLAEAGGAATGTTQPQPWEMLVELVRSLIVAIVVAGLAAKIGIHNWAGATALGIALWIGFPFVLWVGAVVHENVPVRLAAIHAGDWLVKLLLIAVIVGVWQR